MLYVNNENIGFDANILKCYNLCQTEYIWILSDDDGIIPESINEIFDLLNKYDVICLNDLMRDGKLGLKPYKSEEIKEEWQRWDAISKFVWISRLIIKKAEIDQKILEKYLGTGLIHLGIVNQKLILEKKVTFCITSFPVIINQPHLVFSANFIDVFVNQFYNFCQITDSKFSKHLSLRVAKQNIPFMINAFLAHKRGKKIIKYKIKFIYILEKLIKYRVNPVLIMKFILIFILPSKIFCLFKSNEIEITDIKETFI
jgi:hypothetical protein